MIFRIPRTKVDFMLDANKLCLTMTMTFRLRNHYKNTKLKKVLKE